jgi:hypothetical protein
MSIYKNFRNYGERVAGFNTLSKRFDQPTYMTFRLEFGNGNDAWFNTAAGNGLNYDRMPHPLFGAKGNEDVLLRESYSSINYLMDANEHTRAKMLEEFINKFKTLQTNYQYYFQELTGVEDLLKINPKKGMRIGSDKRLVIKMLEGIDLRVSHLMNLYKKIAWDDTYQRWVLPDMMRYFTLTIYVSEFRTFHTPNQYNGMGIASGGLKYDNQLYLNILDDVFPSWVIKCEMCEFDIENIGFEYLKTLSTAADPAEASVTISIKVGKIYEEQVYPIFQNMYLIDKMLNGFERTQSQDIMFSSDTGPNGEYTPISYDFDSTKDAVNSKSKYGSNFVISQETYNQDEIHQVGKPFNQQVQLPQDLNLQPVNPTDPNTWVGNAMTFGKAFVTNLGKEYLNKAKITPVPGLGFSFSEAISAIQSKDIVTAFGLIRKSINQVTETAGGHPSDHLGDKITDAAFKNFLTGISKSAATSSLQIAMQEAAGVVLSDSGIWEKIKDFSKATDLVGNNTGEINTQQTIQGKDEYRKTAEEQSIKQPLKMQRIMIEGIPSSTATTNAIIKG